MDVSVIVPTRDRSALLALTLQLHSATFDASNGTDRVVTHLRLDERRGEPLTLEGKVKGALGLRPDQQ